MTGSFELTTFLLTAAFEHTISVLKARVLSHKWTLDYLFRILAWQFVYLYLLWQVQMCIDNLFESLYDLLHTSNCLLSCSFFEDFRNLSSIRVKENTGLYILSKRCCVYKHFIFIYWVSHKQTKINNRNYVCYSIKQILFLLTWLYGNYLIFVSYLFNFLFFIGLKNWINT